MDNFIELALESLKQKGESGLEIFLEKGYTFITETNCIKGVYGKYTFLKECFNLLFAKCCLSVDFLEKYFEYLDLSNYMLYKRGELPEWFLIKHKEKFSEHKQAICHYCKLSENFIVSYPELIEWKFVNQMSNLTPEFIEKHLDKLDIDTIYEYGNILFSEDFITKHMPKTPKGWKGVLIDQKLSNDFIDKYVMTLNDWEWLSRNRYITTDQVKKYYDKLMILDVVENHQVHLDDELMEKIIKEKNDQVTKYLLLYHKVSPDVLDKCWSLFPTNNKHIIFERQKLSEWFLSKHEKEIDIFENWYTILKNPKYDSIFLERWFNKCKKMGRNGYDILCRLDKKFIEEHEKEIEDIAKGLYEDVLKSDSK